MVLARIFGATVFPMFCLAGILPTRARGAVAVALCDGGGFADEGTSWRWADRCTPSERLAEG